MVQAFLLEPCGFSPSAFIVDFAQDTFCYDCIVFVGDLYLSSVIIALFV